MLYVDTDLATVQRQKYVYYVVKVIEELDYSVNDPSHARLSVSVEVLGGPFSSVNEAVDACRKDEKATILAHFRS